MRVVSQGWLQILDNLTHTMTAYFIYIACPNDALTGFEPWTICDIIDEPGQSTEQNAADAFLTAKKLREFYPGHLVAVRPEHAGQPIPV